MILGLDPSSKVIPWARGHIGCAPVFGVFELPEVGRNKFPLFVAARDFIADQIENHGVTKVRFEAPYTGKNPQYVRRVTYVDVGIELACADAKVICLECDISSWRSKTHGRTQAPKHIKKSDKTFWIKRRAIEFCRERGWPVKNDDEAEACCIWAYQCGMEDTSANFANLPLMAGAA